MAIQLTDLAVRAANGLLRAARCRTIRKEDKKICRAHPDWTPLTAEELSRIDARDKYGYTIYKNMTGETENLPCFIADAPYRTVILPLLDPENHTPSSITDVIFSDKNYHDLFMPGVTFPHTVLRRVKNQFFDENFQPISGEEALRILAPYDQLVFKQTIDTGHGTGVRRIQKDEYASVLTSYAEDYLVQELVRQHDVLAYFNPSSVNVIRITSVCWKGTVYILGGILRVGAPGSFCDHESRDGKSYLTIPLADDGTILPKVCDIDNYRILETAHGVPVRGQIPRYEDMKELVRREHIRYPWYALIGWDFTVDHDGNIICMEFNTKYPGLNGTQCALGPVFAQKTPDGRTLFDELMSAAGKK